MSASAPGSVIAAQERGDAAVVAAQLEDLLDDGAVLALEVAGLAVDRDRVGALVDLDEQPAVGHRLRGAGDAAVQALQGDGAAAAGQADAVGDLGDRADAREVLLVRGTSSTRSSSPASIASVSDMPGKTTTSSSGTRRRRLIKSSLSVVAYE